MESVSRYPLEWPLGWKRTQAASRIRGSFAQTRHDDQILQTAEGPKTVRSTKTVAVSTPAATQRLEDQLDRLGATVPTLSTNVSLRLDGRPRGSEEPADPGAAIYFSFKGKATVLACDRYLRCADNIAALAAHIDALRRIERYGVGTIEQALAGYKALPADTAANWRAVFGFPKEARPTLEQVDTAYKALARLKHPDVGGTEIEMAHLNRARDFAIADLVN